MWISKACIFTTSTDMNTIHANLDFSKAVWIGCKVKKEKKHPAILKYVWSEQSANNIKNGTLTN